MCARAAVTSQLRHVKTSKPAQVLFCASDSSPPLVLQSLRRDCASLGWATPPGRAHPQPSFYPGHRLLCGFPNAMNREPF